MRLFLEKEKELNVKKDMWCALLSGFLGALFFFLVFGGIFLPTDIRWILADGWDTFQMYIGWVFFRNAPWTFPVGINLFYGYPIGLPLIYTDSLPFAAIILKIFSGILPQSFQYIGIWILVCSILQGVFGYFLSKIFLKHNALAILGSIFFIISPIILTRIPGHAALAAHWIILASFLLIFRKTFSIQYWQWSALLCISILVHPYLFFMTGALMCAWYIQIVFIEKRLGVKKIFLVFVSQMFLIMVIAYTTGMFYIGKAASHGFGIYSANLNAFINPYGKEYSQILHALPMGRYQYEGFGYLGFGILLLLFLFVVSMFHRNDINMLLTWFRKYVYVFLMVVLLFIFSLSNHIFLNDQQILFLHLPQGVIDILAIVRSSGRFLWPLYYFLFFIALASVRNMKIMIGAGILLIALCIQLYDLSPAFLWERERFFQASWESPLKDEIWQILGKKYKHISFIPYEDIEAADYKTSVYMPILFFAAQQGLSVNNGYYARRIKGDNRHISEEIFRLKKGEIEDDTLYVFPNGYHEYVPVVRASDLVQTIDGVIILAPRFFN